MSIAFKEWALVCEALGRGDQSLILRKGGIAEGREGFRFKHDEFLLFPTFFHEQLARTVLPAETPLPQPVPGVVTLRWLARVEWTELLTDWNAVQRLAPFHIWREEIIAERFRYDDQTGVHVAVLRIFRLDDPLVFADARAYGGCRSWVTVPDASLASSPVLDDAAHAARVQAIRAAISPAPLHSR
jgi:hypothetical protein